MKLKLKSRRDQMIFFLGYVARKHERQLNEALDWYADRGFKILEMDDVFEVYPFNDDFKQIIKSFHIRENGNVTHLANKLHYMLDEFIFLASDFDPPCCGDGRSFYCRSDFNLILLECSRCAKTYDLFGNYVVSKNRVNLVKADFVELFGEEAEQDWPFHEKLQQLKFL